MEKVIFAKVHDECTASLNDVSMSLGQLGRTGKLKTELRAVQQKAVALREKLRKFNKQRRLASIRELIGDCDFVHNRVQSAIELMSVGEFTVSDIPSLKKQCMDKLVKLRAQMDELSETDEVKEKVDIEELITSGEKTIQDVIRDSEKFRELRKWRSHLPPPAHMWKGKRSMYLYMPIIAEMNQRLTPEEFRAAGIKADTLDVYAVLFNQIILALNPEAIEEGGYTTEEYKDSALKALSRKTGKKMIAAVDAPLGHPASPKIRYYWLMPEKEFARLQKLGNGHVVVYKWGFTF